MDAEHFDHLAKACAAVGSRRWVLGGLLGGVLGVSRIDTAGAGHKPLHHCTPSDQHPCGENEECREVNAEWTCQQTCIAPGGFCDERSVCCQVEGQRPYGCNLEAPEPFCDNDPGTD